MVEKPVPDSALVRFLLNTHHVRFIGKRLIRTYRSTTADGMQFVFHTRDGSERNLLAEILDSHVYERFPIRNGDVVVDVGANIGIFTVMASRLVGKSGTVVAVEPTPSSFRLMKRNLSLNKCENVRPVMGALGEDASTAVLNLYNRSVFNSFISWSENYVVRDRITVQMQTLDSLIANLRLDRLDILKIDTEGYELPILKGGIGTLRAYRPCIVGEAHPTISDSGLRIAEFLSEMGYECQIEPMPNHEEIFYARPSEQDQPRQ